MVDTIPYAGGCTSYSGLEVPELAAMVGEDHAPSWAQVAAWRQTSDFVAHHVDVVQRIRQAIVAAWPPQRSPASQVFLDQLDTLTSSMIEMRDVAASNANALIGVVETLTAAADELNRLHASWQHDQKRYSVTSVLDRVVHPATPANLGDLTTLLTGAAVVALDPNWKQALNQRARQVMAETDGAVYSYGTRITSPTPYELQSGLVPATPFVPGGTGIRPVPTGPGVGRGPAPRGYRPGADAARIPESDVGVSVAESPPTGTQVDSVGVLESHSNTPSGRRPAVQRAGGAGRDNVDNPGEVSTPGEVAGKPGVDFLPGAMTGAPGGRQDDGTTDAAAWQRWRLPVGVPPVLLPTPVAWHNPGPGVLGIDR